MVPIAERHFVLAFRCMWKCEKDDHVKAELNIHEKRIEMHKVVNSFSEVVLYFSCLTLTSKNYRYEVRKRKRQIQVRNGEDIQLTSDDFEEDNDEDRVFPGMLLKF